MKIVLATWGSRGDVQPILALALALKHARHEVLLAAPPEHAAWIEHYDCPFRALGRNAETVLDQCPNAYTVRPAILFLQVVRNSPHNLLFPRLAAIVHHGGAGTTATAAKAGVPQIIVPHILDQYYWANRVHRSGLGPEPIWRSRLTRKGLSKAIEDCLSNRAAGRRAKEISTQIQTRDSLGRAVSLIESAFVP